MDLFGRGEETGDRRGRGRSSRQVRSAQLSSAQVNIVCFLQM